MDAKEFVKKFGWDEAQEISNGIPDKFRFESLGNFCWDMNTYKYIKPRTPRNSLVNLLDLKTLVDAYELVQHFGGLDNARNYVKNHRSDYLTLKMAIKLVESVDE